MDEEPAETRSRVIRRVAYGVLGVLILAPIAIGIVWTQRKPIAREFLDREFKKRGVPATYEIVRVGTKLQRIEKIVVGDPKHPDLTADWAEIDTITNFSGVRVKMVRAHGVRLRGALVDGKLKLGALDRLIPPPTGEPFSFPDIEIKLSDARGRLDTEFGAIGARLDGGGNPANLFEGKLALVAPQLERGDCRGSNVSAYVDLATQDKRLSVNGSIRATRAGCGANAASGLSLDLDAFLPERMDSISGYANMDAQTVTAPGVRLSNAQLKTDFATNDSILRGKGNMRSLGAALANGVSAGLVEATLTYDADLGGVDGPAIGANGFVSIADARPTRGQMASLARVGSAGMGTPVQGIAQALQQAIDRLGQGISGKARYALEHRGSDGALRLNEMEARSRSGAAITLVGRDAIRYLWREGGLAINGRARIVGGGFPESEIALSGDDSGFSGVASIAPIQNGAERVALSPVRFSTRGGHFAVDTVATIDSRLGNLNFAGLQIPISLGRGASPLSGCRPISLKRLDMGDLVLGQTNIVPCLAGDEVRFAMLDLEGRYDGSPFRLNASNVRYSMRSSALAMVAPRIEGQWGNVRGKLSSDAITYDANRKQLWVRAIRSDGRLGSSPFTLTGDALRFDNRQRRFALDRTVATLGGGSSASRFSVSGLSGTLAGKGMQGAFAGGQGRIGSVPLNMSGGQGNWRFANNILSLDGQIGVADTEPAPRFNPLITRDFKMRLADGRITADGTLSLPNKDVRVASVDIDHRLSSGTGRAILNVSDLRFDKDFQPEELTKITLGVIALVEGSVRGRGEIRWTPRGVTSDGRFATDNMGFAAAFGPVKGLKGEIAFTDLLGLVTAPDQTVTIADINSGVQVLDGVIRYRLVPGLRAEVDGGRWPFAGGELILEPTTLDLSESAERRLTFRVTALDAAKFINQLQLENIEATGTFDGVLPMVFDKTGGRIVAGNLIVREGGGTLSYVGEVSRENLGTYGSIAFDALKSMRYRRLAIDLDGALDGEMISKIRFNGVNQLPIVPGRQQFPLPIKVTGLSGIPFIFNITIRAPFRSLVKTARDIQDPTSLIAEQLERQRAEEREALEKQQREKK